MKKKPSRLLRVHSLRIYLIGLAWICYALVFPFYRITDYLICAAVSAVIGAAASLLRPKDGSTVTIGSFQLDAADEQLIDLLTEANGYIERIRHANDKIPDPEISRQLSQIELLTVKIFEYIKKNPQKTQSVSRVIKYYLPATIKLLDNYIELNAQGIETQNISATLQKIRDAVQKIEAAFEAQLNNLYADVALDVSTDIEVLVNVLSSENLIKDDNTIKPQI